MAFRNRKETASSGGSISKVAGRQFDTAPVVKLDDLGEEDEGMDFLGGSSNGTTTVASNQGFFENGDDTASAAAAQPKRIVAIEALLEGKQRAQASETSPKNTSVRPKVQERVPNPEEDDSSEEEGLLPIVDDAVAAPKATAAAVSSAPVASSAPDSDDSDDESDDDDEEDDGPIGYVPKGARNVASAEDVKLAKMQQQILAAGKEANATLGAAKVVKDLDQVDGLDSVDDTDYPNDTVEYEAFLQRKRDRIDRGVLSA